MKLSKKQIPKQIRAALAGTGLPFTYEMGGRHIKIRLDGHFISILPRGSSAKSESYGQTSAMKNQLAQIKRAAREIKDRTRA